MQLLHRRTTPAREALCISLDLVKQTGVNVLEHRVDQNNNNNNNTNDNIYGAVIVAQSHCESSPGSCDEYGTAPSGRRPSDQAKRLGL